MHERLQGAAALSERSISEEIEARLAQSFEVEGKMAAFREEWEKHIEDLRQVAESRLRQFEELQVESRTVGQELKKQMAEQSAQLRESEHELGKHLASAMMVDILIGDDNRKSNVLRRIVLEMATWSEDWWTNREQRKESLTRLTERIRDAFEEETVATPTS
jgi:hypothetical protein